MSDISPEFLQLLEQKARERAIPKNSWEGYAILLRYWNNAFQRIPTLANLDATDDVGIDRLFVREISHLAVLVNELFSEEGFEELATYLYDPAL